MRIAFFGGSFDPPHRGHLAVARAAASRLALDRVLMAPVALQPLKGNGSQASFEDRLAMVALATEGDPRLAASDLDAPRADQRPNYTLDTLVKLRSSLPKDDTLFCLLGADALLSFRHWHRAAELLLFCDFIVAGRPGFALNEITALLPAGIRQLGCSRQAEFVRFQLGVAHGGGEGTNPRRRTALYLLTGLDEDVSATEIRSALAGGSQTQTVLAAAVANYIRAHGLYRQHLQHE
jgi:nicotinate-nucleotide adenylyltransferase